MRTPRVAASLLACGAAAACYAAPAAALDLSGTITVRE